MSREKDLAIWCSYLVSFYCLFRKSNTVPKSASKVNLQRTLLRRHIRIDNSSNTVYVHVTFSKTIQFGDKDIIIPIPGNSDPALDPVRQLKSLFQSVKGSNDAAAFSFSKDKFITYTAFTTQLKKLLSQAGYNPSLYTGHSFRRGGATFLFKLGASILQIHYARLLPHSYPHHVLVVEVGRGAQQPGHLGTFSTEDCEVMARGGHGVAVPLNKQTTTLIIVQSLGHTLPAPAS